MNEKQAKDVLARYRNGQCSDDERIAVERWIEQELAARSWDIPQEDKALFGQSLKSRIDLARHTPPVVVPTNTERTIVNLWPRMAAAVVLFIAVSVGLFFYTQYTQPTNSTQPVAQHDIAPGGSKAFLTLANGKRISLTDARNGEVAKQAGIKVTKTASGQLVYTVSESEASIASASMPSYNTIETPKGGQYQVRLPDGSTVWLNAASSLTYPISFKASKERRVQLSGEAYFEIAPDKAHPFLVQTNQQTVTVLGTHFNVNAYSDEPAVKTTLLEGSVRLAAGSNHTLIKPGQQAVLTPSQLEVVSVDTEDVTAWKNGMFQFSEESLESIMRKVSRWYDVDIEYADAEVKALPFTGVVTHFTNVSQVLRMLELTKQVHFKIEGKKIIVMK